MSWICENCSSANEDEDTECFVCGQKRTKGSVLEAKRAKRSKVCDAIAACLATKVYLGIKILLILLSVMLFAAFLISIVANDVYACFPENAAKIWGMISDNAAHIGEYTKSLMSSISERVQRNAEIFPIFERIIGNTSAALTAQRSAMCPMFHIG